MSSRRKARELALQLLFQQDLNKFPSNEILEVFWTIRRVDSDTRHYAEFLFETALECRSDIDDLIRRHSQHWRLERMAAVDRNILRLAVTEFLFTDTPTVVAIDEAIEIARKFSTDDSTQFVNGVLDAIRVDIEGKIVKEEQHEG